MTLAGLVNLAMMIMAASLFHGSGLAGIETIEGAFDGLEQTGLGQRGHDLRDRPARLGLRLVLGGTMAGQVVMQGFIQRRIPIFAAPRDHAGAGPDRPRDRVNPTDALVISQVVLSFGIPFALVPLVLLAGAGI